MIPKQSPPEQVPSQEQAPPEQTSGMLRVLDDLAGQAQHAMKRLRGSVDDAPLPEIVSALELLARNVELLHQMVSAVNQRAAHIREREVTERRSGTILETMDSALVTISHGQETAKLVHYLLSMGRRELVRVDEGEV
ncbi:hypothetical protein [Actinomadura sp. 3N508]|uniref:hypothetical protein n=1 Tax=Actinomadura sp. 3N508 TaxID=3375153 RepID=UPI0037A384EC